jgi:hypothetical protein
MLSTCFHAGKLLYFDDMFFRNVGLLSKDYMSLYSRRQYSAYEVNVYLYEGADKSLAL